MSDTLGCPCACYPAMMGLLKCVWSSSGLLSCSATHHGHVAMAVTFHLIILGITPTQLFINYSIFAFPKVLEVTLQNTYMKCCVFFTLQEPFDTLPNKSSSPEKTREAQLK